MMQIICHIKLDITCSNLNCLDRKTFANCDQAAWSPPSLLCHLGKNILKPTWAVAMNPMSMPWSASVMASSSVVALPSIDHKTLSLCNTWSSSSKPFVYRVHIYRLVLISIWKNPVNDQIRTLWGLFNSRYVAPEKAQDTIISCT